MNAHEVEVVNSNAMNVDGNEDEFNPLKYF